MSFPYSSFCDKSKPQNTSHKELMENKRKISAEEVLSKIKDDGDFDKLRLKIIRKVKEDAELRDSIISMVKQSAALNCPGAESMKPRQLSDAINQEIGNKVMSQISDGVWKVIRSGDEMKTEITETVQSVYDKLLKHRVNEDGESSSHSELRPVCKGHDNDGCNAPSASEIDVRQSEGEPNEPPGFSLNNPGQNNKSSHEDRDEERLSMSLLSDAKAREGHIKETASSADTFEAQTVYTNGQPRLHEVVEHRQSDDGIDDDPDVPPGFG